MKRSKAHLLRKQSIRVECPLSEHRLLQRPRPLRRLPRLRRLRRLQLLRQQALLRRHPLQRQPMLLARQPDSSLARLLDNGLASLDNGLASLDSGLASLESGLARLLDSRAPAAAVAAALVLLLQVRVASGGCATGRACSDDEPSRVRRRQHPAAAAFLLSPLSTAVLAERQQVLGELSALGSSREQTGSRFFQFSEFLAPLAARLLQGFLSLLPPGLRGPLPLQGLWLRPFLRLLSAPAFLGRRLGHLYHRRRRRSPGRTRTRGHRSSSGRLLLLLLRSSVRGGGARGDKPLTLTCTALRASLSN